MCSEVSVDGLPSLLAGNPDRWQNQIQTRVRIAEIEEGIYS